MRVMTPDHASPEQIRGELISTASDIYVLGVLLYECCAATSRSRSRQPPRRTGTSDLRRDAADAERGRSQRRATSDSGIAKSPSSARRAAASCGVSSAAISTTSSRWRCARSRSAAIRRSSSSPPTSNVICDGMPVLARADSWRYRAEKFVRSAQTRGRLGRGVRRDADRLHDHRCTCSRSASSSERDVAETERARAESERERAEAVSDS